MLYGSEFVFERRSVQTWTVSWMTRWTTRKPWSARCGKATPNPFSCWRTWRLSEVEKWNGLLPQRDPQNWESYWSHLVRDTTPGHWPVVAIKPKLSKASWGGLMCAEAEYSAAFGVWPCGWEWTFGKLRSTMYDGVTFESGKDACNPSKVCGDDWRCIWPWLVVDIHEIHWNSTICTHHRILQ